jgi:hypothetical protein
MHPDGQRQRCHQRQIPGGITGGDRADAGGGEDRRSRLRTDAEVAGRPDDGVRDQCEQRGVEAGHRRHVGELGVGHALRDEHGADGQPGQDVDAQPAPLVVQQPVEPGSVPGDRRRPICSFRRHVEFSARVEHSTCAVTAPPDAAPTLAPGRSRAAGPRHRAGERARPCDCGRPIRGRNHPKNRGSLALSATRPDFFRWLGPEGGHWCLRSLYAGGSRGGDYGRCCELVLLGLAAAALLFLNIRELVRD